MKKITRISIVLLISTIVSSCGKDDNQEVQNNIGIKSEDLKAPKSNQQNDISKNVILSTDDTTEGLFELGMGIDAVFNVIDDNDFEVVLNENQYDAYDQRGVLTLDKDIYNKDDIWDNSTYLLDIKGNIRFVFDENSELMEMILTNSFDDSIENSILYKTLDKTEHTINLNSTPQDIIEVYGEPDEIIESDGFLDYYDYTINEYYVEYYEYMINENLYLEILTNGNLDGVIYQINYARYKPYEWKNKDNN